jgi:hypothetical protein
MPPPTAGAPGPLTPPPMATPPTATMGAGMTAQVRVEINNVVKSLIRVLGMLKEVRSDEARAVMAALKSLEKVTPDVDDGVSQSEVKALMASAQTAAPGPGARPGANTGAPGGGLGPRPPSPMGATGIGMGAGPVPGLDLGGAGGP